VTWQPLAFALGFGLLIGAAIYAALRWPPAATAADDEESAPNGDRDRDPAAP
jgi:hypothetical protein